MALGGENPFVNWAQIGLNDPIWMSIEKKFHDDGNANEFDNKLKEEMAEETSEIISLCIPKGLWKPFPKNNISFMVLAGAKGSNVNQSQISCMLG